MTIRPPFLVALFTLALATSTAQMASARGPSTEDERTMAVGLIHLLETDPFAESAKDARAWLTLWLIEVPDISLKVCADILGADLDSHKKFAPELVVQQMYSMAAFVIEHPDQASDTAAANTAGVVGVLKAYRAILEKHPHSHFASLDGLLERESSGELPALIAERSKTCK
jgi:carboxypeptidase Q